MSAEMNIDRYRLLTLMMTGQTSQVWEVVETSSGRHFALKLLLPEHSREPQHRFFLFHEAEVGLKLHHPNVIRILGLVRSKENPYILMEFFPSKNLKLRLMHKDPMAQERARWILEQAAGGLAHVNEKGWVHRDVKPDNILVNASAEVRVIDFALAKRAHKGRGLFRWFWRRSTTQGTRSYMSPEQIRNDPLDARADVYSFGATMYEVLTMRPPFRAATGAELLYKHLNENPTSLQQFNPNVSQDCAELVLRMLAKKKEERPRDFHDVVAQLRGVKIFQNEKLESAKP